MSVQDYLKKRDEFSSTAMGLASRFRALQHAMHNLRAHPARTVVLNTAIPFPDDSVQWATTRIDGNIWPSAEHLARLLQDFQAKRLAMEEAWKALAPEARVGLPKPPGDAGI